MTFFVNVTWTKLFICIIIDIIYRLFIGTIIIHIHTGVSHNKFNDYFLPEIYLKKNTKKTFFSLIYYLPGFDLEGFDIKVVMPYILLSIQTHWYKPLFKIGEKI